MASVQSNLSQCQIIWTLKSYKDAVPDKTIGHPLHHIMSTTRSSGVISNVAVEELCCPHSVSLLVAPPPKLKSPSSVPITSCDALVADSSNDHGEG